MSCPALWNVLHDAIIVGLNGQVPGTVQLELECDYLRERIDHPGNRFFITLSECTRFAYRLSVDDTIVDNPELLALRRLWITRADAEPGFCRVHCTEHIPNGGGGTLEICAAGADLRLDGGKAITLLELEHIADEYWTEWELESERARRLHREL